MKPFIKYPLILIWRIWFYILFALVLILLIPILLVFTISEAQYKTFFKIARIWAFSMLWGMGFSVKKLNKYQFDANQSYVFVANHTSMIDIMLMLALIKKPFVFVGKKELQKLPIFGFFYRRTSILVDRSSAQSRKEVYNHANRRITQGLSIAIFPEGLVPSDESVVLAPFKRGAFSIAYQHQLPILPMIFYDCKKRFSYTFLSGAPGPLSAEFLDLINLEQINREPAEKIKNDLFKTMFKKLYIKDKNCAQF